MPNSELPLITAGTDTLAAALAAAAREATSGPWVVIEDYRAVAPVSQETIGEATISSDVAYIALASPSNVLTLLEEREALRAEVKRLNDVLLDAAQYDACCYVTHEFEENCPIGLSPLVARATLDAPRTETPS